MNILLWVLVSTLVALNTLTVVRPGDFPRVVRGGGLPRRGSRPGRRRAMSSRAINFWNELTTDQQDELLSVATQRTYARGAVLFHEGEPADHVVLIRTGWTKICIQENGREQVLAERGPGELIGERAALHEDNVRSATVIAAEPVEALVLPTPVFANFIGRYPRVLHIVESQVYNRLTETPDPDVRHARPATPGMTPLSAPAGENSPNGHRPLLNGHACTIVMTDIVGYNASIRTASDRQFIRQRSNAMTRDAFVHAGIPWDGLSLRDLGDGLLAVVPPVIPPANVMQALDRLATELMSYNRRCAPPVQIRLRVAVHLGPVITDEFGPTGESIILVARMLAAGVLGTSMADTRALLGVIASTHIYDTVIKDLDVEGYRKVRGKVKESRLVAWIQLTGSASPPA